MNTNEFEACLIERGSYQTSDGLRLSITRIPGVVFLWFYLSIAAQLFRAGFTAMLGRFDTDAFKTCSYAVIGCAERCGCRFHIKGMDNIKKIDGPVVFIANHMSTLETFALPVMILAFRDVAIVLKRSLMRYPGLGAVLRAVQPIVVDRVNAKKDLLAVLEQGEEMLRKGRSILLFPQSTRTTQFDAAKFNTMGIRLARKADVPIVPVAVKTDFWGTGKLIKDIGPINPEKDAWIEFGQTMTIKGNGKEQQDATVQFILERLERWQEDQGMDNG